MKFITLKYWFNLNPGSLIPWAHKGLILFIILLFGASIYIKYCNKNKTLNLPKLTLNKLSSFFITNGIIGLVLLFFTYQQISFFSSRFWFIVWAGSIALCLYNINKKMKLNKEKKDKYKKESERKKYMP